MAQVREATDAGHVTTMTQPQSTAATGLRITQMLLKNPAILKKMMVMGPDEPRYVRRPREYELPEYRKGMKVCTSNEKYLRPTRYCNPREPLIVAMAHELGAYELSDWEFAEAAYWFVKTKLAVEMLPLDSVSATLLRGTGTCYHLTSLWLALCRAAGIKGRYQTFTMRLPDQITNTTTSEQGAMTVDFFNRGTPEAQGEVCVDGKWTVGHVAMRPEILARSRLPISKFGEDAGGLVFKVIPGTIKRFESIPLVFWFAMNVGMRFVPAAMERTSFAAQTRALVPGRKIIEQAGGLEAYDQQVRKMRALLSTKELVDFVKESKRRDVVEFRG
jgi:Transglutaminase-like superfamily